MYSILKIFQFILSLLILHMHIIMPKCLFLYLASSPWAKTWFALDSSVVGDKVLYELELLFCFTDSNGKFFSTILTLTNFLLIFCKTRRNLSVSTSPEICMWCFSVMCSLTNGSFLVVVIIFWFGGCLANGLRLNLGLSFLKVF